LAAGGLHEDLAALTAAHWEAFRDQARADLRVFDLLHERAVLPPGDPEASPECHALHYLQMADEKTGKALAFLQALLAAL